jgi:hypothetical protein
VSERGAARRSDVVILTTTREELEELLDVDTGAIPGSLWRMEDGPGGLSIAVRPFLGHERTLHVAAAALCDMEDAAPVHTLLLAGALEARCIAVCGACSARRDVEIGDVVVAERLVAAPDRPLPERSQHDLAAYELRGDWRAWLEALDAVDAFRDADWLAQRPLASESRELSALAALFSNASDAWPDVEGGLGPRAWMRIIAGLHRRKWLESSGWRLTSDGRRRLAELLREHDGELPGFSPTGELQPFRIHVAPIHVGHRPIDDAGAAIVLHAIGAPGGPQIPAAVLAALAHRQSQHQLDVVVLGSVMDIAGRERDDQLERFAERAAAECSLWLVRQRVVPRPADPE